MYIYPKMYVYNKTANKPTNVTFLLNNCYIFTNMSIVLLCTFENKPLII